MRSPRSSTNSTAYCTAARNCSSVSMTWSAGMTTMTASGSRRRQMAAERPMHGAVSRLHGSPITDCGGKLDNCSLTEAASRSLVSTKMRSAGTMAPNRSSVAWSMVRPPAKSSNCLGRAARLAGQNRVPAPPAMITACSIARGLRCQVSGVRCQVSEFRVQSSEFRVQSSEFRVQSSEFRVQGSGFRVQGSGFRVQGSGFRVQGSGFGVQGSEFRVRSSGRQGSVEIRVLGDV